MIYSFSRLSSFQGQYGCPWKFYLKYIRGIPEPPSEALNLGKAAHTAIETAVKYQCEDLRTVVDAVASAADVNKDELLAMVDIPEVHQAICQRGNVETHFKIFLGNDFLSPTLQGYIDYHALDRDRVVLIDWKTNQIPYEVMDTPQVALYAAWLGEKYSLPVIGKLVFLRYNLVKEHQLTEADIDSAVKWAREVSLDIESRLVRIDREPPEKLFSPEPGQACQYCTYNCIENDIEIITNHAEAIQAAGEILKLESRTKHLKDRLKNWIEVHGPVRVNNKEFSIQESFWWKWPEGSLENAVRKMQSEGYDPLKILRLTAESLKKLPWSEDDILQLGAEKIISKKFGSKKI